MGGDLTLRCAHGEQHDVGLLVRHEPLDIRHSGIIGQHVHWRTQLGEAHVRYETFQRP